VITTLAVIAGAAGADLDARIGIILGLANLVADGLSMGASNYLGLKSELEQANHSVAAEAPWRHGLATAAAFAIVGTVPLAGYALAPALGLAVLPVAGALAALALVGAGFVRAPFVRKRRWASAAEMLAIGGAATAAAYGVGAAAEFWLR
jgi:vacuolar iron transporter family protein